jgi:uncharacterized protein YlxP (DUF503 family)
MSAPTIGVLILELHLTEAQSLKDKRHYVKGLKERLRHRYNVSVAEIGDQDVWKRGLIAVATVSSDRVYAEGLLMKAEEDAANFLGPFLVSATREWLS